MAQTLLPKNLISAVEGTLQRATIQGMRVHTAVGRSETGSARFSNQSILFFSDIAAGLLAARSKAESVRPLFEDRTPSSGTIDISETLRLRGVTPNIGGTIARRRTRASDDYYSSRGAGASSENPIFIFEGAEFFIDNGATQNPAGSAASFVKAPRTVQSTEDSVTLSGGQLQSTGFLGDKHEETIAYLEDTNSGDEFTARVLDPSNGNLDTTAPDADYDVTYFDHACAELGRRHKTAIVEFASALAFASIGEQDTLEAALSNFGDEIQRDVMPAFDLTEQET